MTEEKTQPAFSERLEGPFYGVLRWPQLETLWERVTGASLPWYFYQVGEELPADAIEGEKLTTAIRHLDQLLRADHQHDYCGIVYADDLDQPTLIKVYDPNNLGSSCGSCGYRIPPRWIISQIPPTRIDDEAPTPKGRSRWWQRLIGMR